MVQTIRRTGILVLLAVVLAFAFSGKAMASDPPLAAGEVETAAIAVTPEAASQQVAQNRSDLSEGTYYLQSSYSEASVLGVNGSKVLLEKAQPAKDQQWKFVVGDDGFATIRNVKTGKVLTVKGGRAKNGAVVMQHAKKAEKKASGANARGIQNPSQKWVVKERGSAFVVVSALNQKMAVSIGGTNTAKVHYARLKKYKGAARQLFAFVSTTPAPIAKGKRTVANGVYLLATNQTAKFDVTIQGALRKSGTNVRIGCFAASQRQAFKLAYDRQGFYTIMNTSSKKFLAPSSNCSLTGLNVGQYKFNKKSNRFKWRIDSFKGGYRLVNKATGLALEVADAKHPKGSAVIASRVSKDLSQRIALVKPSKLSPPSSEVVGVRYIALAANSEWVIGSQDDSRFEYAQVALRRKGDTNLQRFSIENAGKGKYIIRNSITNRLVTLGKITKKDTSVKMRWDGSRPDQRWRVVYNDDFTYAFVNVYSGKYLEVVGEHIVQNAMARVTTANSSSEGQKFKLIRTDVNEMEGVVLDVPCYIQYPELPTGCESVALTNLIRYWGFDLSKTLIANYYMPCGSDGVWNFIGNLHNDSGWIICAPGIADTATEYLEERGGIYGANAKKGVSLSNLQDYLYRGEPLVVWTTIGMGYPGAVQAWNSGYPLRSNNHAVVLCGYDPATGDYLVADSLDGVVWRDGGRFEWLYDEMGRQAVQIYRK